MLDPETLRTFVSVAETGSFSRAAENSIKPPPQLAIASNCWKITLASRSFAHHAQRPADPAGMHLLAQAREWLGWIDSMPGELQQINDGVERRSMLW